MSVMRPDGTGTPSGTWNTDSDAVLRDTVLRSTRAVTPVPLPGERVRNNFSCTYPLSNSNVHRSIKSGTAWRAPFQLDQGSTNDRLRLLRDACEGEPMGIQAAPEDKEMPGIQIEGRKMNQPKWAHSSQGFDLALSKYSAKIN